MNADSDLLTTYENRWSIKQLRNGITVFFGPTTEDAEMHLSVLIKTGTREENQNNRGITHLLEHMMFRGSERYPSFAKLAEAFSWLGGEWNAGTGHEHTEFWFSGHKKSAVKVIELFGDFLSHPAFEGLEIEREIIFREIEGELNEFGLNTDLDLHVHQLFWPETSMAHPMVGYKSTIASLGVADLKSHMKYHYQPNNLVICVMGTGYDESIVHALESAFSNLSTGVTPTNQVPTIPAQPGPHVRMVPHHDSEYSLQLSFLSEGASSSKAFIYELISHMLTDGFTAILGQRIREQLGLVYDIDSQPSLLSDIGTFDISATVHPERILQLLKETEKILRQLCDNGPSPELVSRTLLRAAMEYELSPNHADVMAFRKGWAHLCDETYSLSELYARCSSVNATEIKQVCQELFTRKHLAVVLMGPSNATLEKKISEWSNQWFQS